MAQKSVYRDNFRPGARAARHTCSDANRAKVRRERETLAAVPCASRF